MNLHDNPRALFLLGREELRDAASEVVPLTTRKAMLLLAVLTMSCGKRWNRSELAAVVWPDAEPKAARDSLRTALAAVRKAVPNDSLECAHDLVWLNPTAIACDALDPVSLEGFVGDFMPGFDSDWVIDHRFRIRALYVRSAIDAANDLWAQGKRAEAIEAVEKACRTDPFDEEAVSLRIKLLDLTGQHSRAVAVSDAYRVKLLRDLGVVSEVRSQSSEASLHPLVAAVEWLLDRNPEEACSVLAGTESQWYTMGVEQSLNLHQRALAGCTRASKSRTVVESQQAYLLALCGRLGASLAPLTQVYKNAIETWDAGSVCRLASALAYGHLSKGEFKEAMDFAREPLRIATAKNDLQCMADAELLMSIIEQHVGNAQAGRKRSLRAWHLIQECGSPMALANFGIVRSGMLAEEGHVDEAVYMLESARRIIEAHGGDRVRAWQLFGEATIAEAAGDYVLARSYLSQILAIGPKVGGHSVIGATNDSLTRIDCVLQEFDTAAEALGRASAFRRSLGTVASRYERSVLAPSIHTLKEKLNPADLRAAYLRAGTAPT